MSDAYKAAGVDIDAGERLVGKIGPMARSTARPGADAALGGFGGLFDLKKAGFDDPILVSGTDGVGTKVKLAFDLRHHKTIGIDLVAMCANDVLAQGAEPLFFLDYFATGKLHESTATDVVSGIADGCLQAGCALVGGETAEMPGMYADGEYDLAGFCVGAVERQNIMPRTVNAGDIMIGIQSSGPHANGYSLIRKIIVDAGASLDGPAPFDSDQTLGAYLMAPTRIYVKSVLPLLSDPDVKAFAHITGGGLVENVPRVMSDAVRPQFDDDALKLSPLFDWLRTAGKLERSDLRRTFNCGVGGVLICKADKAEWAEAALNQAGENARIIGEIVKA